MSHPVEHRQDQPQHSTTGNLVNAPFGGIKSSSTSTFRESGRVGMEFFTQTKIICRAS